MKHSLLIIAVTTFTSIFIFSLAVVGISPLRSQAIKILSNDLAAQQRYNLNHTTPAATILADPNATTSDPNQSIQVILKGYSYKFLINVDPCTLTKLGKRGWQISQISGTIGQSAGKDETCNNPQLIQTFDWILFVKDLSQ